MAQGQQAGGRGRDAKKGGADQSASSGTDPRLAAKLRDHAEDPDEVRKALDDAAGMSRNLWLAFLTFGTYLVISVASVTHRDLFLESAIKLPLLNVELPLVGFFVVAPLLFVIFHAYLLLNLKLLADNVERYNDLVQSARPVERKDAETEDESHFRLLLPNFAFVQLTAGPSAVRHGRMGWLLRLMVWLTVVIGPIALLLLIEFKFLPYHLHWLSWWHRILLACDVLMLWSFWPHLTLSDARFHFTPGSVAGLVLGLTVAAFAVLIATFPGERMDKNFVATATPIYAWLFSGSNAGGYIDGFSPNFLIIQDGKFPDKLPLVRRDLRDAILVRCVLHEANLTKSDLRGADLSRCDLRGADLTEARLQGATLVETELGGTTLDSARFEAANLELAHLEGANAEETTYFETADLTRAHFEGATLLAPQFLGAKLANAKFIGAKIKFADFSGATFDDDPHFDAMYLPYARLWRTRPLSVTTCELKTAPHEGDQPPKNLRRSPDFEPPPVFSDEILESLIESIAAELPPDRAEDVRRKLEDLKEDAWTGSAESDAKNMWIESLAKACEDEDPKTTAESKFAKRVRDTICHSPDAEFILPGLIRQKARLRAQYGSEAISALNSAIFDPGECPKAHLLREPDRSEFLDIMRP
jgi:uncharacterized protein YjbI with pentapeptide repeats